MYDYQKLDMHDNTQLKAKLLDLLEQRYQKDSGYFVNKSTIEVEHGLTAQEAYTYADYLVNNNWALFSEPDTPRWRVMITEDGLSELTRLKNIIINAKEEEINKVTSKSEDKLAKIQRKIEEQKLEAERRQAVVETKKLGAEIEIITILREELKRKDENSKEIAEIKSRLSKLENIFSNPQGQIIDNVYRPCYNQMINVYRSREFIHQIPDNKWTNLEAYWKLKTPPEMIELFEKYTKERKKWSNMWVEFENAIQYQRRKLGDIIAKAFDNAGLIKDGDVHIELDEKSSMETSNWIQAFDQVIFDSNIQSGEQLYKTLLDYSIKTRNGHQKWLEKWWDDNNGLFTNIIGVIPELIKNFNCSVTKKQMDEQREILKENIEKLTLALENKLK